MNSIVYLKALVILFIISLSILLCIFLIKKLKLNERIKQSQSNDSDLIQILEVKKIDQTKSAVVIKSGNTSYVCILAENYGFVFDKKSGGESRIRTYERTRRADLQSAAFGHSATSPNE